MDEKIEKFIKEHGHAFHSRVVKTLRDKDWTVLISPIYRDNGTDKARETDIIAEKEIYFGMGTNSIIKSGFFRVRLVIECKFIKESTIFWFDKKDINLVERRIIEDIPCFKVSSQNNSILNHHWRSTEDAAKLYATYNPNSQERQQENEIIFSSIDKTLNCLINYHNHPAIIPREKRLVGILPYNTEIINYPVIICNSFSKFFETNITGAETVNKLIRNPNFEIEVNYEYVRYVAEQKQSRKEYFLIDVVDFNELDKYLEMLKNKDLTAALSLV